MSKNVTFSKLNGSKLKIGIVASRWNSKVVDALVDGCMRAFEECKVKKKNITVLRVPGSYELPFAARQIIEKKKVDAVVCLGCLIKGETMHFEFLAQAVAAGIMELNVDESAPVVFGVLTCLNEKQARVRSTGKNNHGYGWGLTAVEMGLLSKYHL